MSDTFVTLQGWVGTDVTYRSHKGVSIASMRVAVTPRVKREGQWQDGETTWYSITAWRTLAEHVCKSVKKGDAVLIHGRLRSQTWQKSADDAPSTTLMIEAISVGHDLLRGTSAFLKTARAERSEDDLEREVNELLHQVHSDVMPMDSFGNPLNPESEPGVEGADDEAPRLASGSTAA
jgi:single-strand DNA-binding protein